MTRLTPEMVALIPSTLKDYDEELKAKIGCSLRELAVKSANLGKGGLETSELNGTMAGVVPITSGEGVINGFCEAVASIINHVGIHAFTTENTDISGITEALDKGADILFVADDFCFAALNLSKRKYVGNAQATALGYVTALELAANGLKKKRVLVIGAGKVGRNAIKYLTEKNALVTVVDKRLDRARKVKGKNVRVSSSIEKAIKGVNLVLNASPAVLQDEWIRPETILVSPGVPLGLSKKGREKIGNRLIHDPLQIGVAVMAVKCAGFGF
jgi:pyrrolysine biosynthesis protein PylD